MTEAATDDFDDYADDCCPNCGGDGVIYCCHSEYACTCPRPS